MIVLNMDYEIPWLESCLNEPDKIKKLPAELYHKFFDFLIQEDRIDDSFKLTQIKQKVVDMTMAELIAESEIVYSSDWDMDIISDKMSELMDKEMQYDDAEFCERLQLICRMIPANIFVNFGPRLDKILDRRTTTWCEKHCVMKEDYNGLLPYKLFKIERIYNGKGN